MSSIDIVELTDGVNATFEKYTGADLDAWCTDDLLNVIEIFELVLKERAREIS